jgi:hypothetical protein
MQPIMAISLPTCYPEFAAKVLAIAAIYFVALKPRMMYRHAP